MLSRHATQRKTTPWAVGGPKRPKLAPKTGTRRFGCVSAPLGGPTRWLFLGRAASRATEMRATLQHCNSTWAPDGLPRSDSSTMAARLVRRVALLLLLLLLIGAQAQAGARTDIIDVAVVCAVRRRQVLHHRHTVRADCVAKRCYRWGQKVSSRNSPLVFVHCPLSRSGICQARAAFSSGMSPGHRRERRFKRPQRYRRASARPQYLPKGLPEGGDRAWRTPRPSRPRALQRSVAISACGAPAPLRGNALPPTLTSCSWIWCMCGAWYGPRHGHSIPGKNAL